MSFQREYLERCVDDESFFGFGCNFVNNLFGFWFLQPEKMEWMNLSVEMILEGGESHFLSC